MIKVLIADDSAFMRLAIEKMLSRDSDFEVIGFCSNGEEVIEKLKTLKPDVLTLDIEMPRMNGLEVLDLIMSTNPIPIVMVSSLTTEGAEETIKALELGAIDVVAKPNSYVSLKITDIYDELALKLKSAVKAKVLKKIPLKTSGSNLRFLRERIRVKAEEIAKEVKIKDYVPLTKVAGSLDHKKENFVEKERTNFKPEVIVLGISTGGPASLQKLIPLLNKDLPCGMVVAQHMPPGFTQSLANRLNQTSSVHVKEAEDGEVLSAGKVLVAPSGLQTRVYKKNSDYYVKITDEKEKNYLYKPCVDILFSSASESAKDKALGIIMTGMGNDGSKGCVDIHHNGGMVIAQSEETCVISTMPNSAIKEGIVDKIVPLDLMAKTINNLFKKEHTQEL